MKLVLSVLLLALCAVVASAAGTNYAVLVAGSNGYYNYRHQSDICHAFHVLTDPAKGNIPAENIIVFMYDDIANSSENPFPGTIINHPNGTDVYNGVNKDYTGAAVTPQNFLAVLSQNKSGIVGGSGKVLQSTEEDNVFVYFSDHGATGLIAFPSDYLYANDLMNTLKYMNDKKMYRQLVFYIEACESGSMFNGLLPGNINIYATTASTPDQSSYACYWDAGRNAYLGDEYSVRWMEDSDVHDAPKSTWTLLDQFKVVANETLQSQPQQYGELSINTQVVQDFQGFNQFGRRHHRRHQSEQQRADPPKYTPCGNAADSRDVKLKTLLNRRDSVNSKMLRAELDTKVEEELMNRAWWDLVFDNAMVSAVGAAGKDRMRTIRHAPRNFDCLKAAVASVEENCGRLDDYSLKHVYTLANMCEEGVSSDKIATSFETACRLV